MSKILIAYATQTGMSEEIAKQTAMVMTHRGHQVELTDFWGLKMHDIREAKNVLFLVSTMQEGFPPYMADEFDKWAMNEVADLAHLNYAVAALGDTAYHELFCYFGYRLDSWLTASGANQLFDVVTIDDWSDDDVTRWLSKCIESEFDTK